MYLYLVLVVLYYICANEGLVPVVIEGGGSSTEPVFLVVLHCSFCLAEDLVPVLKELPLVVTIF